MLYEEGTEQVFLMLHSGSRNIGNTTAQHYDKAAAKDMQQRGIQGPSGLNYLEIVSQDGAAYLQVGHAVRRQTLAYAPPCSAVWLL